MKKFTRFFNHLLLLGLVSSSLTGLAVPASATENVTQNSEESLENNFTNSEDNNDLLDTTNPEAQNSTNDVDESVKTTEEIPAPGTNHSSTEITPKEDSATTIPLQLLGINDFHGALSTTGTAYIENIAYRKAGTAALLASYLNSAESTFKTENTNGTTIRVQAGDMVGASPANSGLLQDEPTIKALNRMNFEIGTLGNHEFDEGLGEFNRILTGTAPLPGEFNSITENYSREASSQEIVIANMVNKGTTSIPYGWKPYTVKEIEADGKSVKVGFIGIVTTEIPNLVLKKHYENFDFLDEADTIVKYEKELRSSGVNAIVVLAHVPAVSTNQVVSGEAADIMTKVNAMSPDNSVDAFFAGHNHQYTNGVVGHTRIVQSTSQGKAFINLKGQLNSDTQDFIEVPEAEVTPVMPVNGVIPNSEVAQIVTEADDLVQTVTNEKIGTAATPETITRDVNEAKESAVGNLVTDGQRELAKDQGFDVDFAMTNNGGIRADLLVNPDRSITWGAAQNVQPFGNLLQVVSLTGAQVEQVLNEQYDEEQKYFLQISGLSYQYTDSDDSQQPYKVHEIRKKNGELLDPNATYSVVINDFLFGGGDGFKTFSEATFLGAIDPDTETFINYIKKQERAGKVIDGKIDGRKTYVTAADIENTAIEAIKSATTLSNLREGDPLFTGKTIPNGIVAVQLMNATTRATTLVSGSADESGAFTLNVESLNLVKDQVISVSITNPSGYTATFQQTVLEKASTGEEENQETKPVVTPPTTNPTSDKESVREEKAKEESFPQTSEKEFAFASFGFIALALGTSILYAFKQRKVI